MKIQFQNNYNKSKSFQANYGAVYGGMTNYGTRQLLYRTNSFFYNGDLQWNKLVDELIKKYANTEKVNIHCYACSEGAEPFSLAMLLLEKLGKEKAQKFLPIMASDIDPNILKNPMNGIIQPSSSDIQEIKRFLGDNHSKYIEYDEKFRHIKEWIYIPGQYIEPICSGRIKPLLKDTVQFKNVDIFDDINNIQPDNSVVMFRNFLPYLKNQGKDEDKLIEELYRRIGHNSFCVIGDYDGGNIILGRQGFRQMNGLENCYEKSNSDFKNSTSF